MIDFEFWDRLISLLFPKRCVICHAVVDYDTLWCGCSLPEIPVEQCVLCRSFPCVCTEVSACQTIFSPFYYHDVVRKALLFLKSHNEPRLIQFFTEQMIERIRHIQGEIQGISFVPTNQLFLEKRGFNPCESLADSLGSILQLPVWKDCLIRDEDSLTQHSLSFSQRIQNANRSYHLHNQKHLAGATVLLVDDICTTGSTLNACATQLKKGGAKQIYGLTVAASHSKI